MFVHAEHGQPVICATMKKLLDDPKPLATKEAALALDCARSEVGGFLVRPPTNDRQFQVSLCEPFLVLLNDVH